MKLYKIDTKGKVRTWEIFVNGDSVYTVAGIEGGSLVTSTPTTFVSVNVGKANEKSGDEVAQENAKKQIEDQIDLKGYAYTLEEAKAKVDRFEVTLAERYDKRKQYVTFPVMGSPKLDGMRCYITKDGMFSRNHKPIVSAPHIHRKLKSLFSTRPNAVVDGEIYNHELKNDFEKVISLVKKTKPNLEDLLESEDMLEFHIFDCYDPDKDPESYAERFASVEQLVKDANDPCIRNVASKILNSHEEVEEYQAECLEAGYEGAMIRLNPYTKTGYEKKRSKDLLKVKTFTDSEFVIVDVIEGVGNRSGVAGRIMCRNEHDQVFESGISGNMAYFKELLENKKEYIGKLATIQYQNLTSAGVPRFPVMKAIRDYE